MLITSIMLLQTTTRFTNGVIIFQGKTMYQAEIDICELVDFYRFNVEFVQVACDASNDSDLIFFNYKCLPT